MTEVGDQSGVDRRTVIDRDPAAAAGRHYDVVVIGGGIFGAMIAAEATSRRASVLLLEMNDFGAATSFNSLKTIHGGLRYLQSLNVRQHRTFVRERKWFLERFPHLVERLPVLMPLYGQGLRRPVTMRAALLVDHLLSADRNSELTADRQIPKGSVVSPEEVERLFPLVRKEDLRGGAVWFDACMPDPQRLLVEVLRWARGEGLVALNYTEAVDVLVSGRTVHGVRARDRVTGDEAEFRGRLVVNATGPWCRAVGRTFDRDHPRLFRHSIAWNVLVDRKAISSHALAVSPQRQKGRVYFVHPWKGRLLIGTGHAPRETPEAQPEVTESELRAFVDDINHAIPRLNLSVGEIQHVFAGYLPATKEGTVDLAPRAVILNHSRSGGPGGLFSVAGNKFTASRDTAQRVVHHLDLQPDASFELRLPADAHGRTVATTFDFDWLPERLNPEALEVLEQIIRDEAVVHLDDLILRRTGLGDNPRRALALSEEVAGLFDWAPDRQRAELERLRSFFRRAARH